MCLEHAAHELLGGCQRLLFTEEQRVVSQCEREKGSVLERKIGRQLSVPRLDRELPDVAVRLLCGHDCVHEASLQRHQFGVTQIGGEKDQCVQGFAQPVEKLPSLLVQGAFLLRVGGVGDTFLEMAQKNAIQVERQQILAHGQLDAASDFALSANLTLQQRLQRSGEEGKRACGDGGGCTVIVHVKISLWLITGPYGRQQKQRKSRDGNQCRFHMQSISVLYQQFALWPQTA